MLKQQARGGETTMWIYVNASCGRHSYRSQCAGGIQQARLRARALICIKIDATLAELG